MNIRELEHQSILESEGKILVEAIKYLQSKLIFESGSNNGYATGWLLSGVKAINKKSTLISCDPRREPDPVNLLELDRTGFFIFHKEKSQDFLEKIKGTKPFDFCFLDGDHRNFVVYKELELLEIGKKDKPVVFLHDVRMNAEIETKDPYRALIQYIKEKCNENYSLFSLILPTSLATNLNIEKTRGIVDNCKFDFSCQVISLADVVKRS